MNETKSGFDQPGGLIWRVMPDVRAEIGCIAKDQKNSSKNYQFRGIDGVLNALGPALTKFRVTPSVRVTEHRSTLDKYVDGGREKFRVHSTLRLAVRFTAEDGSFVESECAGEALDYQDDKSTNKAHSNAYKYCVLLGLAIPVIPGTIEDSDDHAPLPDASAARRGNGQPSNRDNRRPGNRGQGERRENAQQQQQPKQQASDGTPKGSTNGDQFPNRADTADTAVDKAAQMKRSAEAEREAREAIAKAPTIERLNELHKNIRDPRRPLRPEQVARLDKQIEGRGAYLHRQEMAK